MTRAQIHAALATATVAGATALGARTLVARLEPGGPDRWRRTNYAARTLTLAEGPAAAVGLATGLAAAATCANGEAAGAAAAASGAALGAGAFGVYDDLYGATSSKGFGGHLRALRRGEVTSGIVKIIGIGAVGLAAASRVSRNVPEALVGGAVVAGTANLWNLFDLRPGRALKFASVAALPLAGGTSSAIAGAVLGTSAALLPADLGEHSMLGDAGANAVGAALGVGLVSRTGLTGRCLALAGLVALTAASERISFTKVIESTPGLAEFDRLGRRGA